LKTRSGTFQDAAEYETTGMDYLRAIAYVVAFGIIGTTIAVLVRSTPIALSIHTQSRQLRTSVRLWSGRVRHDG
jgi:hypothetical protein